MLVFMHLCSFMKKRNMARSPTTVADLGFLERGLIYNVYNGVGVRLSLC